MCAVKYSDSGWNDSQTGAILNTGSVLARHPEPRYFSTIAYAASKGAIEAMSLAAAAYYAPSGIRINVLAPGLVRTPMSERRTATRRSSSSSITSNPSRTVCSALRMSPAWQCFCSGRIRPRSPGRSSPSMEAGQSHEDSSDRNARLGVRGRFLYAGSRERARSRSGDRLLALHGPRPAVRRALGHPVVHQRPTGHDA